MKIINKIKAFFFHEQEPVELDLVAAEIKEGKAYLHPKGEKTTYMVRSDDIRITLSEGRSLTNLDIISIGPKDPKEKKKPVEKKEKNGTTQGTKKPGQVGTIPELDKYKKRTFSVSVYEEEYDFLVSLQKEYGYKRADFVLACVQAARKTSVEKAHRQIEKEHKELTREQREQKKRQQAEKEPQTA